MDKPRAPLQPVITLGILLVDLVVLYLIFLIYSAGQTWIAISSLVLLVIGTAVYFSPEDSPLYPYRFLFPGLFTFGVFVIFPIVYTFVISFTNYGVGNLYAFDRIWDNYFSKETYSATDMRYHYDLYPRDGSFDLVLREAAESLPRFVVEDLDLEPGAELHEAKRIDLGYEPPGEPLSIRAIITHRQGLQDLQIQLPTDPRTAQQGDPNSDLASELTLEPASVQTLIYGGLREFQDRQPRYQPGPDQTIIDHKTGDVLRPNFEIGYYINDLDQRIGPGFSVNVGAENYRRIFADPHITGPFVQVFLWTLIFSLGSVFLSLILGATLAVLLNWESIQFRQIYRALYTLPYAVPAFISILVFRGLFNPSFGEINQILETALGIQPEWFTDPTLAKVMVLIVNTWLSYPYMMILITGILQSIPHELYEASAIDGSGPLRNFFQITLPLLLKPILPVLISSFAFAFNNFVLIFLLTGGGPNRVNTTTSVGETDILVSYTYRLAFGQAEAQYGFAAAIATVIYLIVLILAAVNLRLTTSQRATSG